MGNEVEEAIRDAQTKLGQTLPEDITQVKDALKKELVDQVESIKALKAEVDKVKEEALQATVSEEDTEAIRKRLALNSILTEHRGPRSQG